MPALLLPPWEACAAGRSSGLQRSRAAAHALACCARTAPGRLHHDGLHQPRLAGQPGQRHGGGPPGPRLPGGCWPDWRSVEQGRRGRHQRCRPGSSAGAGQPWGFPRCRRHTPRHRRGSPLATPDSPPHAASPPRGCASLAQICIQPTLMFLEARIEAWPRNPRWNRASVGVGGVGREGTKSAWPGRHRAGPNGGTRARRPPGPADPAAPRPAAAAWPLRACRAWRCACGSGPSW